MKSYLTPTLAHDIKHIRLSLSMCQVPPIKEVQQKSPRTRLKVWGEYLGELSYVFILLLLFLG